MKCVQSQTTTPFRRGILEKSKRGLVQKTAIMADQLIITTEEHTHERKLDCPLYFVSQFC